VGQRVIVVTVISIAGTGEGRSQFEESARPLYWVHKQHSGSLSLGPECIYLYTAVIMPN